MVLAVSMHSAESWHGSGRQITCHPLAFLPLRIYLHAPLTSPVLSLLTGTWKRTRSFPMRMSTNWICSNDDMPSWTD